MLGRKRKKRLALGMAAVWLLMLPGCTWRTELSGGGTPVETQPVQTAPASTEPEEDMPETERLCRLTQRAARDTWDQCRLYAQVEQRITVSGGWGRYGIGTEGAVTYETVENSSHFRLSVEEEYTRWWDAGTRYQFSQKRQTWRGYSAEGLLYVDDGEERYITTASYITETNHTRGIIPLYLNESYVQDASLTEMDGQKRVRLTVDPEALPLINSWLDKNILREGRAVSLEAEYWIGDDGKLISQTFLIGIMGREVFGEGEDWETAEEVQGQEVIRVRYPFTGPDGIPAPQPPEDIDSYVPLS